MPKNCRSREQDARDPGLNPDASVDRNERDQNGKRKPCLVSLLFIAIDGSDPLPPVDSYMTLTSKTGKKKEYLVHAHTDIVLSDGRRLVRCLVQHRQMKQRLWQRLNEFNKTQCTGTRKNGERCKVVFSYNIHNPYKTCSRHRWQEEE